MEGVQMTQEEQRIAIAEACGWKTGYRDPEAWHPLPDYLNDLNAMHEAERLLDEDDQWLEYMLNLQRVLERNPDRGKWVVCQDNMHATAAQRAEAFLRTIGEWKECK
jgi:hypothetical protein